MLMQYFQPVAVLAERRIRIYENQVGPYYQMDVTETEVTNTPVPGTSEELMIQDEGTDSSGLNENVESLEDEVTNTPATGSLEELINQGEPEQSELNGPVKLEEQDDNIGDTQLTETVEESGLEVDLEELVDSEEPFKEVNIEENVDDVQSTETEQIDEIENTELIEIAPIEFREVETVSVVEPDDGFVLEKTLNEQTVIYRNEEDPSLKQMIISDSVLAYQNQGRYEMIETSLEKIQGSASTYGLRNDNGWQNITNTLKSYYPVDLEEGVRFTVDETSVNVKPLLNPVQEPQLLDNQIIYPMEGQVNLRYTIGAGVVSEDIMIYHSEAANQYRYEVMVENGTLHASENAIAVASESNELLMYITAPIAYDSAGSETTVELTYENGIMIVVVDEEWLKSEERVYPIIIDPEYSFSFNSSLGYETSVTASSPNTRIGALNMGDYGWILPSNLLYHAYIYLGDTANYKDSYSFYKVNHLHDGYDLLDGMRIKKAELTLSSGSVNADNVIIASMINQTFDLYNATYNNRPTNVTELSRTPITAGQWAVTMDITDYMRAIFEEGVENNSIMLQLENQRGYATFQAYEYACYDQQGWYTPYVEVTYWDEPEVQMIDLNEFVFNLRPFVISDYETGSLGLTALGLDGTAPAGGNAQVSVEADDTVVFTQTMDTDDFYIYPGYNGIQGAQTYTEQVSNWQTDPLMTSFESGKVYEVTVSVSKDGQTSTQKTSQFQILEVKALDTIGSVAEYYGVSVDTLKADNNMTDDLIVPGNILFIREPQTNLGKEYVTENLSEDEEQQVIAALRGRELTCEYGLIPVNLNTGSFLLESSDFSYNLFNQNYTFTRSYNSSAADLISEFGFGWSFSGNYAVAEGTTGATVLLDDGTRYYFELNEDGSYTSDRTKLYRLRYETDHFVLESKEKTVIFNSTGKPSRIEDHTGLVTEYTYEGIHLTQMTFPDGKTVNFEYTSHLITKATLSDETFVTYGYDENKNLVSFTDQTGKITTYVYDEYHNMTSWINPNEETVVTNTYDTEHRITKQVDSKNQMTTITYTDGMTEITDPKGNVKQVYKDGNAYTTKVIYPDNNQVLKIYEQGLLVSETLETGVSYTYTYDDRGHLTKSVRNDGFTINYEFDANDNLLEESNSFGQVKSYTYDDNNNMLTFTDELGKMTRYTYNEFNQKLTETDPLNNTTTYEYNQQGKVSKKINPDETFKTYEYNASGYLTKETDEFGNVTEHMLNARNQIVEIKQADGGIIRYVYDDAGNLISETNPNNGTISYEVDVDGNIIKKTDELGYETLFEYDANQNLTNITYPNGAVTSYVYDERNRVLSETVNGQTTAYTYNKYGIATVTNPRGQIKTNNYDTLGRLVKITDFDGKMIQYSYDVLARVLTETDKKGLVTSYEYDSKGNITKVTTARNETVNEYNDVSLLVKKTVTSDDSTKVTEYSYDSMRNLITLKDPMNQIISYQYTANRMDSMSDALNRTVNYGYDTMNRVVSMTYSDETVISWGYDIAGNKVSETDGRGNITTYRYNARNDLIEKTDALDHTTSYQVDAMGNVTIMTTPMSVTTGYTYDLNGNILSESISSRVVKEYVYDAYQNLISATEYGLTTTFVYDEYDQIIKMVEPTGLTTDYVLDEYHRVTQTKVNSVLWESAAYDIYDQVTSFTDRYGKTTTSTYNDDGLVIERVTEGLTESFVYDLNDQVIQSSDNLGNAAVYTYDAAGNQTSITLNGHLTSYEYDLFDRLVKETDSLNRVTQYSYDKVGNLVRVINGENQITVYGYDALNQKTSETADEKLIVSYQYDADQRLIKTTDGEQGVTQYVYDSYNQLIKEVDPMGYMTQYEYDTKGNLVKVIDAKDNETIHQYNELNQLIKTLDEENNQTLYEYDVYRNVVNITDDNDHVETSEYNNLNQLIKTTAKNGLITTYTYNKFDQILTITSNGETLENNVYDALGRVIEKTDALNHKTSYNYDKQNNLILVTDALNHSTSFEYDGENQLIKSTDPKGIITNYEYDGAGRENKIIVNSERITEKSYDGKGNLITLKDGENNITTYEYDSTGDLIKVTDGSGVITEYEYNAAGYQTAVIDGLGNKTETIYNEIYDVIQSVDGEGNRITYTYNDASHLIRVQDARGYSISYEVDGLGNILKQTQNDKEIIYTYNAMNQMTSVKDIDGKTESFEYDLFGNLVKQTQKDGTSITRTYDLNGNKLSENETTFSYDALDHMIQMTDPEGTSYFSYDAYGNMTYYERHGYPISYYYNAYGEKEAVVYPDDTVQLYRYDKAGNLICTQTDGLVSEYEYDGAGRVIKETQSNGIITESSYDAAGRLNVQSTTLNGTEISSSSYSYNKTGSLIQQISTVDGHTTTITHEYDENDELIKTVTTKQESVTEVVYTYSLTGNRATVTNGTTTQSFEYNDKEQLSKVTDGTYTITYQYDDNGNRIKEIRSDGKQKTYTYDLMNRLMKVCDFDGTEIEYSYDGLGNRESEEIIKLKEEKDVEFTHSVEHSQQTQTYTHVQDANEESDELHGAVLDIGLEYSRSSVYINDVNQEFTQVLTRIDIDGYQNYYYGNKRIASDEAFYLNDGTGNVEALISYEGKVIERYEYSDYGERNQKDIESNEYGFNGEAHTADGLQYLRARYYDPDTGVFISADTYRGEFSNPLSQNRYTYCKNNPYKYEDPSGHVPNIKNQVGRQALIYDAEVTSENTSLPTLPKKKTTNVITDDYRALNALDAHLQNQQSSIGGTHLLLGDTSRGPSYRTEALIFDAEGDVTGEMENDTIGTVSKIVTDNQDNSQPYGIGVKIDDLTETKNNYIEDFVKFCSSATEVIHNQAINLWNSFWDDPVGNLTILGGIAISAGAAAATFGLSALVSAATWAAGISYTSAAAYSLKQISQGDDEEGVANLLRTVFSAFTAGLLNGMNVEVSSQTKLNFSAGSLALEQTQIPSVSISFSNDVAYDALMAQKVAEVNSIVTPQDITVGKNKDGYNAPNGGGGVSDETKIGDKRITFGHGGRHLEDEVDSIKDVNRKIAEDVINRVTKPGDFYKGFIEYDGRCLKYTAFMVDENTINVGTYYFAER